MLKLKTMSLSLPVEKIRWIDVSVFSRLVDEVTEITEIASVPQRNVLFCGKPVSSEKYELFFVFTNVL